MTLLCSNQLPFWESVRFFLCATNKLIHVAGFALQFLLMAGKLAVFLYLCILVLAGLGSASSQESVEFVKLRELSLKENPDSFVLFNWEYGRRGPLFTTALTPQNDLLVLVGMRDGNWHLVRVRDWEGSAPKIQRVVVPGFGEADFPNMFGLMPQVEVTPDGRYAVCIAEGSWSEPGHRSPGSNDVVTVVDLQTFSRPIFAVRTRGSTGALEHSIFRVPAGGRVPRQPRSGLCPVDCFSYLCQI